MPINMQIEYPKLVAENTTLRTENETLRQGNKELLAALNKADDILDSINQYSYMESFDREQIKRAITNNQ